eukprot:Protomagalhaensia_wolfi_Nauph_80__4183@NODE_425_length_2542_cov_19_974830_g318_i0_p1_GENE_NODE_425_length_2542_cov_19_974830_g318_i0NODE_425_length_2542_cov_19_974830_g318_i0_p1_ORF_typecomplete_len518_score77_76COesterase/PF00135_28/1_4e85Abhydrolase_3/PF07859_13/2_9e13Abhydrolase_3/PF07859_13/6_4e03Abhydrolase_3/PF07859_13/3_9e03Peptidase_S9/PF00326_21/0_00085Esterase_phd/PF10503_9/0_02Chlorophyllase2/PF12740_7/0_03Say1_Mug180/PF10340_9/0_36_NODE_425_length_2542_cov_19_974830_g318_i01041657
MLIRRCTLEGSIIGVEHDDYYLFAGIPYAETVRKETRFMALGNPPIRSEPLDCTQFKAACCQGSRGESNCLLEQSDDCLFLNIWVPKECEDIPVMFWIHGGSYSGGAGNHYRGGKLCAEQKIIVITINYRLSVLGFTNWKDVLQDSNNRFHANVGIQDQVQALKWVYHNITFFGGDPGGITIAGESVGSASALILLCMVRAQPYSRRAIMQSGSLSLIDSLTVSQSKTKLILNHLLEGLKSGTIDLDIEWDPVVVSAALKSKDYTHPHLSDIVSACSTDILHWAVDDSAWERNGCFPHGAWYDGIILPNGHEDVLRQLSLKTSLLIGHNKSEAFLWEFTQNPDLPEHVPISEATLNPLLNRLPSADARELRSFYDLQNDGWVQLGGDIVYINTTRRVADEAAAKGASVYRYRVDALSDAGPIGAAHAVELLAFWDMFATSKANFVEETSSLMRIMRDHWGQFIRTGDPGWPLYSPNAPQTMIFDCRQQPPNQVVQSLGEDESPEKVLAWKPHELVIF